MDAADELRGIADEIRAISEAGLHWSTEDPYHHDRYERLRRAAARLFAVADVRSADEIERTLFRALTHTAPVPVADAAVVDDDRILLIQRADNGLWAMPGGMLEMAETPAEGAAREAREEAGIEVEVLDLVGVYDSRLCGSQSPLHMYMFVFLCCPVGRREASTPDEVLDQGWFPFDELPPLSPGHRTRVPDVLRFLGGRRAHVDLPVAPP